MPIPAMDGILNVLPPHLGDPRQPTDLSPYPCTTAEICGSFATSPARKEILEGFLRLRSELLTAGIQGFQWVDGSFVEDVETQEGRDPSDIDVVTFVSHPNDEISLSAVLQPRPHWTDRTESKRLFRVDHFLLPLCSAPERIVDLTRYWYGLFSHRRDPDRTWKGMLRVELTPIADDASAWTALRSNP